MLNLFGFAALAGQHPWRLRLNMCALRGRSPMDAETSSA
jgi:hypothetical protein